MYKPSRVLKVYNQIFTKSSLIKPKCNGHREWTLDYPDALTAMQLSHGHPIEVPETPYGQGSHTLHEFAAANAHLESANHYAVRRGLPVWSAYETRNTWV